MSFRHSVAKAVRLRKEKRPQDYCPHKNCLWKASSGLCPKHKDEHLLFMVALIEHEM